MNDVRKQTRHGARTPWLMTAFQWDVREGLPEEVPFGPRLQGNGHWGGEGGRLGWEWCSRQKAQYVQMLRVRKEPHVGFVDDEWGSVAGDGAGQHEDLGFIH